MSEDQYATALKEICAEYYNRNMSMAEFRARRKHLVDQMDMEVNRGESPAEQDDITQRPNAPRS